MIRNMKGKALKNVSVNAVPCRDVSWKSEWLGGSNKNDGYARQKRCFTMLQFSLLMWEPPKVHDLLRRVCTNCKGGNLLTSCLSI